MTLNPEDRLRALFTAGLDGDQGAYRSALTALARHLRAYLRRRLWHSADVEDLVQESLLAIHLHRHTYDPSQPFTPWAYTVTRHKLIDFTRRHARHLDHFEPLDEAHELLGTTDDSAQEARRDLAVLMDQLPDRYRLPILHTKLEGHSVAEASALTGMSESAIKIGVHRGLKVLARLLRKEHREDGSVD